MLVKKSSLKSSLFGGVFSALLLAFAGFLLLNQKYVTDQVSVWAYEPTSAVRSIEDRIDLTKQGQFYFYTAHPQVDNSEKFNDDCPRQEVGSPILGCYASGRIYVYDVANDQLDGIEEVTAAHEILHSVWERMSEKEQARIGALLNEEYAKLDSDSELAQRMAYYTRTEPGQLANELHSILGTEVKKLSPELESYYAKYFSNRQSVVALYNNYNALFNELKTQSDTLYAALTALGVQIESRSATYSANVRQLSSDIASFNARASAGDFDSADQFNAERSRLVVRSNVLDGERASITDTIESYNIQYAAYQKIATQIETLNSSIDSIKALEPTPSI
jgi:hypothetical protein